MKYIIFDMFEVLIDGILPVFIELAREYGTDSDEIKSIVGYRDFLDDYMKGNITESMYYRKIIEKSGWDISVEDIKKRIYSNFISEYSGIIQLLYLLEGKYELVVLSDCGKDWIKHIKTENQFFEVFNKFFFSCNTGRLKGEDGTFEYILNELGTIPEECIFVDDNSKNVEKATKVGIKSIQYIGADDLRKRLVELGIEV